MSLEVLNFLQDLKKRERIFYLLIIGYQDALEKLPTSVSPAVSNALSELYEQTIIDFLDSCEEKSKDKGVSKPMASKLIKSDPLKAIDEAFDKKMGKWELSSSDDEEDLGVDISDDEKELTQDKLIKSKLDVKKLIEKNPVNT